MRRTHNFLGFNFYDLVDRKAQIRGYDSRLEADAMVCLRHDVIRLLRSGRGVS